MITTLTCYIIYMLITLTTIRVRSQTRLRRVATSPRLTLRIEASLPWHPLRFCGFLAGTLVLIRSGSWNSLYMWLCHSPHTWCSKWIENPPMNSVDGHGPTAKLIKYSCRESEMPARENECWIWNVDQSFHLFSGYISRRASKASDEISSVVELAWIACNQNMKIDKALVPK